MVVRRAIQNGNNSSIMAKQVAVYFIIGFIAGMLSHMFLYGLSSNYGVISSPKSVASTSTTSATRNKTDTMHTDLNNKTDHQKCVEQCRVRVKCPVSPANRTDAENQIPVKDLNQTDHHVHNDNNKIAADLYDSVRVLAWVCTHPANLEKQARHVQMTWAKRTNKIYFASDYYNATFPTMPINVPSGYNHLTAKTWAAFDYIYKHHLHEYDWFLKVDDDTYIIMENLRYFLSDYDPEEPWYFGDLFKVMAQNGYNSGGGGYVLSREALRRLGERTFLHLCKSDYGDEDVEIGRCAAKLRIKTHHTMDVMGRQRFHGLNLRTYLHDNLPGWYLHHTWDRNRTKGSAGISDYAISFHYVTPLEMYELEFFVYHLAVYGVQSGLLRLNMPGAAEQTEALKPGLPQFMINMV